MMKHILATTVLMLMMQHSLAAVIKVNTTEDQEGADATKCSLREAVIASNTKKAFGGCVSGQENYTDVIQLSDLEKLEDFTTPIVYVLEHGELNIKASVQIQGTRAISFLENDAWNNSNPARKPLTVTIKASKGSRIFNTSSSESALTLERLILEGGQANYGGSIRAAGPLSLSRVQINNAQASVAGGAIYLEGDQSRFTSTDVMMQGNQAPEGAVLSMTCFDNLLATKREISFLRTSVVQNGSAQSRSIVEVCGIPAMTITASTFGQNQTLITGLGSDSSKKQSGVLWLRGYSRSEQAGSAIGAGQITIVGMTLTDNQSDGGLVYDELNTISIQNSVMAFNGRYDCLYTGLKAAQFNSRISLAYNFIGGEKNTNIDATYVSDKCHIGATTSTKATTNIYQETLSFGDVLYPLGDYGAYTRGFLPKLAQTSNAVTLVDKGLQVSQCLELDQRSISRSSGFKSKAVNSNEEPRCDIGSFEYSQLTANDDKDVSNLSYKDEIDRKITTLTDQEISELPEYDRSVIQFKQKELTEYLVAYKADYTYRRVYVPILDNDVGLESVETSSTGSQGQLTKLVDGLKTGTYRIKTYSLGTGRDLTGINLSGSQAEFESLMKDARAENNNFEHIKCEWVGTPSKDSDGKPLTGAGAINKLAIWADSQYFSQPRLTPSGEFERCLYELSVVKDGKEVSRVAGIAQAKFSNIKPVATDDEYSLPFGSKQISIDILSNDHDQGDAPTVNGKYVAYPNWPQFYKRYPDRPEVDREDLPIRVLKEPTLGELVFERQGVCPDASETRPTETCYGGKAVYVADSLFSPFNDEFTYEVLDAERGVSAPATVIIKNTATTSDREKVGGGSMGLASLLALIGLAVVRRRFKS
jgi:CSLREA domain-containing protein